MVHKGENICCPFLSSCFLPQWFYGSSSIMFSCISYCSSFSFCVGISMETGEVKKDKKFKFLKWRLLLTYNSCGCSHFIISKKWTRKVFWSFQVFREKRKWSLISSTNNIIDCQIWNWVINRDWAWSLDVIIILTIIIVIIIIVIVIIKMMRRRRSWRTSRRRMMMIMMMMIFFLILWLDCTWYIPIILIFERKNTVLCLCRSLLRFCLAWFLSSKTSLPVYS